MDFEQRRRLQIADEMAGELIELFKATDEIEEMDLPDDGKFSEYSEAILHEYNCGNIDYLEATVKIRDYGRLKLVK